MEDKEEHCVEEYKYFWITKLKRPSGRKTDIFVVYNNKSFARIGVIKWHGAWRQYCFFPDGNTIWSIGCLDNIKKFIRELKEK